MRTVEKSFFQFRIFSSSDERMFTLMVFFLLCLPYLHDITSKMRYPRPDAMTDSFRRLLVSKKIFYHYFILEMPFDTLSRFDHPSSKYILSQTDLYGMSTQDWPIITKQFIYIRTTHTFYSYRKFKSRIILLLGDVVVRQSKTDKTKNKSQSWLSLFHVWIVDRGKSALDETCKRRIFWKSETFLFSLLN